MVNFLVVTLILKSTIPSKRMRTAITTDSPEIRPKDDIIDYAQIKKGKYKNSTYRVICITAFNLDVDLFSIELNSFHKNIGRSRNSLI